MPDFSKKLTKTKSMPVFVKPRIKIKPVTRELKVRPLSIVPAQVQKIPLKVSRTQQVLKAYAKFRRD